MKIQTFLFISALLALGCGDADSDQNTPQTGGNPAVEAETGGEGGAESVPSEIGGAEPETGGVPTGGAEPETGGSEETGGTATGGSEPVSTGGVETGGVETGGSESTGGTEPDPDCFTEHTTNSTAAEKVNAGFCVGVPNTLSCVFLADINTTACESATLWWQVDWYGGTPTTQDTYGIVYGNYLDNPQGEDWAIVEQGAMGEFDFYALDGITFIGWCTVVGDVATACWY